MASDDWRNRLQTLMADFGTRQAEAKAKVRADGVKFDRTASAKAWQDDLVDNGLAGPGWPKAVGGLELSLENQLDYYRMTTAAGMPAHPCQTSFIVAPVLIKFGTDNQRDRYLRPLLRADEFWCQGFSEPGAGSDLASLSTRAVRDGDVYRVNGQKVWTTMADQADWMFALVRTGEPGRGSDGITYLLISMDSPGITVRPLRDISGGAHFAEVFFDDVEVPVDNRLGEEGNGWSIMRTSLGHERATAFLGSRAPQATDGGRWTYGYLKTRASTIGAGTAEIQRNTIAESVLGLPSHRGEGVRPAAVRPGAPLAVSDDSESELREVLAKTLGARVNVETLLDPKRPTDHGDSGVWTALVEFGLPGLSLDESLGGAGAPPRLLYAAIEETAKALAPAALVPTVTALEVATAVGATAVTERIAAGTPAAFAVPLDDAGWVITEPRLPVWDGTTLTGAVPVVTGAPDAEVLLVVATADNGEVLVAVEASAYGVSVVAEQPLDLTTTVGSVTLNGAAGEVLSTGHQARVALETAYSRALLAVAADSIGTGAAALATAVAWAGEREQFGRKIGSFQAISHRCADMLVALEGARSQVLGAADTAEPQPVDCMLAAAAAFDAAVFATEHAIQIHGGIGFTWEHPAHLYLRRARANAVAVGRPESLRDRAVRQLLANRSGK